MEGLGEARVGHAGENGGNVRSWGALEEIVRTGYYDAWSSCKSELK